MIHAGRTYLIDRNNQQVLGTVHAVTKFQAQVSIDGEDDPVWVPLDTIGDEVTPEDLPEEPPLLNLLINAQALIEKAIVQIIEQESKDGK